MSWLPNALSLLRLAAALPLAWLIVQEQYRYAFWFGLAAGLSDGVDGYLARRFGWQSRLGSWLDPIADKALLSAALVALGLIGALPIWLVVLALTRDLCILAGALVFHLRYAELTAEASLLGKLSTALEVLLLLVVLAERAYGVTGGAWLTNPLIAAVALALVVSWIDYGWRWHQRSLSVLARRGGGG